MIIVLQNSFLFLFWRLPWNYNWKEFFLYSIYKCTILFLISKAINHNFKTVGCSKLLNVINEKGHFVKSLINEPTTILTSNAFNSIETISTRYDEPNNWVVRGRRLNLKGKHTITSLRTGLAPSSDEKLLYLSWLMFVLLDTTSKKICRKESRKPHCFVFTLSNLIARWLMHNMTSRWRVITNCSFVTGLRFQEHSCLSP